MPTPITLAGVFAGAVLVLSTAGVAFASPAVPTPLPTGPSAPAQPISPAAVFVSSTDARPGTTIHVSGTCALSAAGAEPAVVSVNSAAFTGPERFSKTDPTAFDGTATIARSATPGRYPVELVCSNSTATTVLQVTGPDRSAGDSGRVPPAPDAPVAHHAVRGVEAQSDRSGEPWLGVGVGVLVIAAAGAASFVVVRGRTQIGGRR
jgi:hypothetical protein